MNGSIQILINLCTTGKLGKLDIRAYRYSKRQVFKDNGGLVHGVFPGNTSLLTHRRGGRVAGAAVQRYRMLGWRSSVWHRLE